MITAELKDYNEDFNLGFTIHTETALTKIQSH